MKLFFYFALCVSAFFSSHIFAMTDSVALVTEKSLSHESLGKIAVRDLLGKAKSNLLVKKIPSRFKPNHYVAEVVPLELIHRLFILENVGSNEIKKNIQQLYDHIGRYGFKQLTQKVSPANASGVMQITQDSFYHLVSLYGMKSVTKSYDIEVKNPALSVEIAMLFVDNALALLTKEEREKVMSRSASFNEYIATAYNGGSWYALKKLRTGSPGFKKETYHYVITMRTLDL